jgi:hypothetical protein
MVKQKDFILQGKRTETITMDQLKRPSVERYTEAVGKRICLDTCRKAIVEETYRTLEGVHNWDFRDGFGVLLLGCKGVGKTELMIALQSSAMEIWPGRTKTLYISYTNTGRAKLPSEIIADHLGSEYQDCVRWNRDSKEAKLPPLEFMNWFLYQRRIVLFLVIDEFQSVYRESCQIGKQIVDEVMELGCLQKSSIHCMISGSGDSLRELVFAKLPDSKRTDYPNYAGIDLRTKSFYPRWLSPFVDPVDFKTFVNTIALKMKKNVPENLAELLVSTGGVPSIIKIYLLHKNPAHIHEKPDLDQDSNAIMKSLFHCIKEKCNLEQEGRDELLSLGELVQMVPLHSISKGISQELIYTLADKGLIRFDDSKEVPIIGFGSQRSYLDILQKLD